MNRTLTDKEKDAGYKLFQARPGSEARLTHGSGHIQIIPFGEWVPVHPMFHADAYANGCVSEDMKDLFGGSSASNIQVPGGGASLSPEARKEQIIKAIGEIANSGDITLLTGGGVPKVDVLSQYAGFTVAAAERDAIIAELEAEAGE